MTTATIDYMQRLTVHMQAALDAGGHAVAKSNAYHGDGLYRSDVRDALVSHATNPRFIATCAEHGGNWSLRLTWKGDAK
jgi:hypothetical protein